MAGSYSYLPLERVLFGQPAAEAAAEETARIGAQRVFIVASKSLARETPVVHAIAEALGGRYAGLFDGCVAHTPWPSVIEAANAVRAVNVKRQQLPAIAEAAMKNLWVRTNPQPIRSREDVMRLLEAAW